MTFVDPFRFSLAKVLMFVFYTTAITQIANAQSKVIFDEKADAKTLIDSAAAQAKQSQKLLLIEFGANWCGDCQALAGYFAEPKLSELLKKNFVVVHVDTGHFDKNLDVAAFYGIPMRKGIPAIAIINADGSLRYATASGEWSNARTMKSDQILQVLENVVGSK